MRRHEITYLPGIFIGAVGGHCVCGRYREFDSHDAAFVDGAKHCDWANLRDEEADDTILAYGLAHLAGKDWQHDD
ncbi:hypothetical protein GCM10027298_22230 [Epidermidibacterium keratini]